MAAAASSASPEAASWRALLDRRLLERGLLLVDRGHVQVLDDWRSLFTARAVDIEGVALQTGLLYVEGPLHDEVALRLQLAVLDAPVQLVGLAPNL